MDKKEINRSLANPGTVERMAKFTKHFPTCSYWLRVKGDEMKYLEVELLIP